MFSFLIGKFIGMAAPYLIMAGVAAGAWFYVQGLINTIDTLKSNNTKLTVAVETQKEVVLELTKDIKTIKKSSKEIQALIDRNRKNVTNLEEKFSKEGIFGKRDLGKLAIRKENLVNKIIQKASNFRIRCFEIASGDKLKDGENNVAKRDRNTVCPQLFDYP